MSFRGVAINAVIAVRVLTIAASTALAIGGTASAQEAEPPPLKDPDSEQDFIKKIDRLNWLIEEKLRQQREQQLKDCVHDKKKSQYCDY
jgi:Spy/CpxP family protein refolding chaperone